MWCIVHVMTTVFLPPGPFAVTVVYCGELPQLKLTGYDPFVLERSPFMAFAKASLT